MLRRKTKVDDMNHPYSDTASSLMVEGRGNTAMTTATTITDLSDDIKLSRGQRWLLYSIDIRSLLAVAVLVWYITRSIYQNDNGQQAHSSSVCPNDVLSYLNQASNQLPMTRKYLLNKKQSTPAKQFTPVPAKYKKTFYYDGSKISMPVARAFRSRGWIRVDYKHHAQLIYTYNNNALWAAKLLKWQRFNYIPGYTKWNNKFDFVKYYKLYNNNNNNSGNNNMPSIYVPETYMLTDIENDILKFQHVLKNGGSQYPWVLKKANVNQGKGIMILAPNSPQLLKLPEQALTTIRNKKQKLKEKKKAQNDGEGSDSEEEEEEEDEEDDDDEGQVIIQRYICNEMTWNNKRKFDVRMYWFVASLDPLIVLYHDGYVRIGNSEYTEQDFSDTTAHLTTHTGLGSEGKASMKELEVSLNGLYQSTSRKILPNHISPMDHVRNQFKHALSEMVQIFKDESFNIPDMDELTSDNGFNFYCADYILDNDLDVWFIEPQNGCGLDEDYYFRLEMHGSLFNGMIDILEEVIEKQEAGLPVLPLQNTGNWEIIYADGLMYSYEGYKRSNDKATCSTGNEKKKGRKPKTKTNSNYMNA